jgi:hypothetical protein
MSNDARRQVKILLEVEREAVTLVLREADREISREVVCDGYTMLEKLLPAIDGILKKCSLTQKDVVDFQVNSSLPEGYSARRIAETITKMFLFGVHGEKKLPIDGKNSV